jgi:hypothetical protein
MNFLKRYYFQITGALVAVVLMTIGIFQSTSSTAAIGFLFLPVAAALGAFSGDAFKYGLEVLQKKRPPSLAKTFVIVAVFAFCVFQVVRGQRRDHKMQKMASSSLSTEDLEKIIGEHLTDASLMSRVAQNPNLRVSQMEKIVSLERKDFPGDVDYDVYQSSVWAQLAKRKDLPEALLHQLAGKKNPEHFLILALLESPALSCAEEKSFLPQENPVLEGAIRRSLQAKKCD